MSHNYLGKIKTIKEISSNVIGILVTTAIFTLYLLSKQIRYTSIFPSVNIVLIILFTLSFCCCVIFNKSIYGRLFLVVVGYLAIEIAKSYGETLALVYDLMNHFAITYYAHRIIFLFGRVNLIILVIRGLKLLLYKFFLFDAKLAKAMGYGDRYERQIQRAFGKDVEKQRESVDKQRESGERGERNVRYHLKWLEGYKVLNNVRVPNPMESQQFDHIVIGKNGIFHIETKNYGGEHGGKIIINKEGDWSIERVGGSMGIENPLFQVMRHERVLKEFIEKEFPELSIPIKEIVVLSNEKTIVEGYENSPITLLRVERLNDFIINYKSDLNIDERLINLIYEKLIVHVEKDRGSYA